MSVADGKIYGLFGPNGAGKSTLLKMLSGLNASSLGEVHFKGAALHIDNEQVKPLIGMVIKMLVLL